MRDLTPMHRLLLADLASLLTIAPTFGIRLTLPETFSIPTGIVPSPLEVSSRDEALVELRDLANRAEALDLGNLSLALYGAAEGTDIDFDDDVPTGGPTAAAVDPVVEADFSDEDDDQDEVDYYDEDDYEPVLVDVPVTVVATAAAGPVDLSAADPILAACASTGLAVISTTGPAVQASANTLLIPGTVVRDADLDPRPDGTVLTAGTVAVAIGGRMATYIVAVYEGTTDSVPDGDPFEVLQAQVDEAMAARDLGEFIDDVDAEEAQMEPPVLVATYTRADGTPFAAEQVAAVVSFGEVALRPAGTLQKVTESVTGSTITVEYRITRPGPVDLNVVGVTGSTQTLPGIGAVRATIKLADPAVA